MDKNTRIKTLLVCCGVIFTDMLGYGIITPSIPIFAELLKASEAEIGFAFSAYPVAFLLVVLPFGKLVESFRRRRTGIARQRRVETPFAVSGGLDAIPLELKVVLQGPQHSRIIFNYQNGIHTTSFQPGAGSFTVKVLPLPGLLSTVIVPLCASTMNLAMDKPSPQPSARRDRLRSAW